MEIVNALRRIDMYYSTFLPSHSTKTTLSLTCPAQIIVLYQRSSHVVGKSWLSGLQVEF